MSEEEKNTNMHVCIKEGCKIDFINGNTGAESTYVSNADSMILSKGFVYKLEINEKDLDLKDYHIVRDNPHLAPKLIVRAVSDGYVTLYPIVNGVVIKNGDFVGSLI